MKIFKFRIPTILGIGMILFGIIAGVLLVLKEQGFISQASPDIKAQNITITNITDNSVTISWHTQTPVASFLTYGQTNPNEQAVLDERDTKLPSAHSVHYVTVKNLLPKTEYLYKIISGKTATDILKFTTATPASSQINFRPVIGSSFAGDQPLDEGIAYLSMADASLQSALIKVSGNFLITLSQIRTADFAEVFLPTQDTTVKLTIVSAKGQSNILFKLGDFDKELPAVKLGEDLDFISNPPAIPSATPSASPSLQDLSRYDLNSDGKINSADNAILLQNFGGNPKNKKADLNGDGKVNQKDVDLMSREISRFNSL
ncbi:hypothetical protein A3C26_02960 [Candidatus Daviesbacteria bacterium RIFCSPHIGHO2_02_FULL_39_12]|uniref:Fibronectin type-III domain-containing protein n=2 Tax=Candidatus Daviesiibacteriota TaxID=1752718 RepID=A0A1F5JE64_9BACT|nr:MAG: hypothetical protein A3C26_02960 [Candidatus Daviesbacteria bacterium RIFCSPHIGHO2_02_FULL_39_12]OGE71456.1 MAG: hypothetical protein A3H40_02925 [Candidatus Daviesbacteria bacterium RIFCSPLOWO2_02_FULL_38_15]